jgi:hypothetical protein
MSTVSDRPAEAKAGGTCTVRVTTSGDPSLLSGSAVSAFYLYGAGAADVAAGVRNGWQNWLNQRFQPGCQIVKQR